ncbi:PRC-barrel domain-containing protein [Noviherbaspirillum sp. UKPF54]|uniref:PRC-barrel domain-containing protein n=1 Tax=Noviherbaspirillum sp. UKPF54 TaxID=2601898 RepID=UPI0011B1774D|nr:PRC-barrel domain-containing protein [Noviherbaspirillum sp. UKPF54]QDZ27053.1 PRC-barrel domain containing protein [Noviherbaspirillum sp. UKPF54]
MRTAGSRTRSSDNSRRRFVRVSECDSSTAQLLHGCPVVTPEGSRIGHVDHLMVDAETHQLRYVMLARGRRHGAEVAIPWHALYFDAAAGRLVFYTWV